MDRIVIIATAGAGGDLPPLVATALALRDRGHEVLTVGDRSVVGSLRRLEVAGYELAPEFDLGPRLIGAIQGAMATTGGDLVAAGPLVQEGMKAWAEETAEPVADILRNLEPAVVMTSLFGVEVLEAVSPACPWVVVTAPSTSDRTRRGRSRRTSDLGRSR